MARKDPLDAFTPRERAAWDTFRQLGEAARRGLHTAERVARHNVESAARRAHALSRWVRRER